MSYASMMRCNSAASDAATVAASGISSSGTTFCPATLLDYMSLRRASLATFCFFQTNDDEIAISFAELFAAASRFRRLYERAGLTPGATVLIGTDFSAHGMQAFVGALIGGFVPAFLAPLTERQHLEQFNATLRGILAYVKPGALVVSSTFNAELSSEVAVLIADDVDKLHDESDRPWVVRKAEDVAFMQFSSGTTGLRKGVMLHHAAVVAQIEAFNAAAPFQPGDLIASWLPLYHDMGLIGCFIFPLMLGVPLALQDPIAWARQPARLLATIERHRATHIWLPNFAFNHLRLTTRPDEHYDLSSVRAFINCSEPCKAATVDAFVARFASSGVRVDMVGACYAMAETVFAVTQTPIGTSNYARTFDRNAAQAERRLVPSEQGIVLLPTGQLLPGLDICIFDDAFACLSNGAIGQIALRGSFLFKGYFANPEATSAQTHGEWFLTGDLGTMLDNVLYVTGRLKDVIIVNGRNFYAHDIEACASAVDGVKAGRATAFAIDNEITGSEEVVLVAETDRGPDAYRDLSRTIKRMMTDMLGLTAVRPHLVPLGWIIKTTSGKISRGENRSKYLKSNN